MYKIEYNACHTGIIFCIKKSLDTLLYIRENSKINSVG